MRATSGLADRGRGTQPTSRRARRRAETRARILRAALDLFARRGFFATTVEQITEAADVGKGTFFNYFPSKEHALAGFGEIQVSKVRGALAEIRQGARPLRDVLRRLAHALAEEPARSPSLIRGLLAAHSSSESFLKVMRRNLARGRRFLAQIATEGQRRGEIRSDIKPAELARLFQQTFFGALFLWALHPSSQLPAWLDTTLDLFWHGVTPRPGEEIKSVEKRP
jgi:AcrR family transcriptional regulator